MDKIDRQESVIQKSQQLVFDFLNVHVNVSCLIVC